MHKSMVAICPIIISIVFALSITVSGVAATERKRLDWGATRGLGHLNVYLMSASWVTDRTADLMEALVLRDDSGNIFPAQAKSWSVSEDGRLFRFNLREDLKWSDGTRIVADDFVRGTHLSFYNYKREIWFGSEVMESLVGAAAFLSDATNDLSVLGVRAENDTTLVYEFARSVGRTPYMMADQVNVGFWPLHPSITEDLWSEPWSDPSLLVTNGPFKLDSIVPNERMTLVKNEHHYDRDNIYFDIVNYQSIAQTHDALVRSILSSELSIVRAFETRSIKWLLENRPEFVKLTSDNNITYIVFNANRAPFDDVKCRRSLIQAIDRDFIVNSVAAEFGRPVERWIPAHFNLAQSEYKASKSWPAFDRSAAAVAIRQHCSAKGEGKFAFDFAVRERDSDRILADAMSAMWRGAGVDVDVLVRRINEHYSSIMIPGDFDVGLVGWHGFSEGPAYFLRMFHTETSPNSGNYGGAGNTKLDALIDQANYSMEPKKTKRLLYEAEDLVIDGAWTLPIMQGVIYVVKHPNVTLRNSNFSRSWGSRWLHLKGDRAVH